LADQERCSHAPRLCSLRFSCFAARALFDFYFKAPELSEWEKKLKARALLGVATRLVD
jgi:hypothetical protein